MRELDAHNPSGGVLSGLLEAFLEILADVSPYEQRNEDSDRGAFEPRGHLIEALLNHLRIEPAVELFVHEVRYVVQLRVDLGLLCTRVNRRRIGHEATVAPQSSITQDPVAKPSVLCRAALASGAQFPITECSLERQVHDTQRSPIGERDAAVLPL